MKVHIQPSKRPFALIPQCTLIEDQSGLLNHIRLQWVLYNLPTDTTLKIKVQNCNTNFYIFCCHSLSEMYFHNPNTIKSYKILQKLSPKHAAHGVAQSTFPIYRHRKACLSKQPRAAGDPCLARGRSRVRARRARCPCFFSPPSLPPLGDSFFFAPSPPTPQKW